MPVQIKYCLKISRFNFAQLAAAVLVFSLSLLILPFYTESDQANYNRVYEALPGLGLMEAYNFYYANTTSKEFVHFIMSWVASRFVEKNLFIAFSNAILAYVAMSLFQKWKASVIIAFLLVVTNFYFFVLYFAAERLKFGFIFLALSMIYIDQFKRFYGFAVLAFLSHVQTLIIYGAILFNAFVRQILKLYYTRKVSKWLFVVPFLFIPLLLLEDQIIYKFRCYYLLEKPLTDLVKVLIFFLLALWYSKKQSETIIIFIAIIFAIFLLGGDRANIFGYLAFLYYGLQCRGGWNFGVIATSAYYAYATIVFVVNILRRGDGFPVHFLY